MELSDLDLKTQTWSIFSRGFTGCGKTIASCGKNFRPVYVFDLDQRMTGVARYYNKLDGHCKDIVYDTYTMGMHFRELDRKMDEIAARPEFKTVVVASLSAYIHIVLVHLIQHKVFGTDEQKRKKGKNIAEIKVNEIEDYNAEDAALIFELIQFLMTLKAQGVNVILEAHLTNIEYHTLEGKTITKIDTLTKGKKAPAAIPGYFDESWLFTKKYEASGADAILKYIMNPVGDVLTDAKTSRGLTAIDWTGKDFTVELYKQLEGK